MGILAFVMLHQLGFGWLLQGAAFIIVGLVGDYVWMAVARLTKNV